MIVWLASYPRSGNTFFRVILKNAFGIDTYSIYNDTKGIGAHRETANIVGHKFLPENFNLEDFRKSKEIYFIKTHELFEKSEWRIGDRIIYLVRDGRASSFSFSRYLQDFHGYGQESLTNILNGSTPYGSWGQHVRSWGKINKCLIKFEDMVENPSQTIQRVEDFLKISSINEKIPTFDQLHEINPKFFRQGNVSWGGAFSGSELDIFWDKNGREMDMCGYKNR